MEIMPWASSGKLGFLFKEDPNQCFTPMDAYCDDRLYKMDILSFDM